MNQTIQISTPEFPVLAANRYGTGDGYPIVLLHGFPADSGLWRQVHPLLSDFSTIIIPDFPGVGKNSFSGEHVSMEALAGGVAALLNHQRIDKAIIAGHSMGGYVALAFAALFPERTAGLSLIHSSAKADDEEKKESRRKAIALIMKGGKEAFINAAIPPLFTDAFAQEQPEKVEEQRRQGLEVEDKTLIAFYNAMINRPDRQDVLRMATFPVQWIIGEHDSLIPLEKVLQQTSLANVNFVHVYKHSGHMAMLEAPQELANDIRQFAVYCNGRQTEETAV
jgi:pimeloyl-ACP methyl ester carboxylesterase